MENTLPRQLKVFRTAVGFRDAYVAAPSKAAALRAWGTDKDLFARGGAEEVDDPALMQDALNRPGEVVYRTRGGLEEQVAALGELPARKAKSAAPAAKLGKADPPRNKPARPPRPKPSRAELEAAEAAIATLKQEKAHAEAELRIRERALAAERKAAESRYAEQLARLQHEQQQARQAYEAALRAWEP